MQRLLFLTALSMVISMGALHGAETKRATETKKEQEVQTQDDDPKDTPLIAAARRGDAQEVQKLLEAGANVEERNARGSTAIIVGSDYLDVVKTLLQYKADVNAQNIYDSTALIFAAKNGHADVVKALLQAGANKEVGLDNGWTALMLAAEKGHEDVVKVLVREKANKEVKNAAGFTPLMIAAQNGHAAVVQMLLQAGADVDVKKADGFTALMISSRQGRVEVVQVLLQAGANKEARTQDGWTSLMIAAEMGRVEVVEALIEKRANIEAKNQNRITALMIAAGNGIDMIMKKLIKAGADINSRGNHNETALSYAIQFNRVNTVKSSLGVPWLDNNIVNSIDTSHRPLSESEQQIKNRKDGVDRSFFDALRSRNLQKIETAIQKLNSDIDIYYVPNQKKNAVLWDNPLHFVLKEHINLIKDITEGRDMLLQNTKDENQRKNIEQRTEGNIRNQGITSAKIIGRLTEINPRLWYEKNSDEQTPFDLAEGLGIVWLLDRMPQRELLAIKKAVKEQRLEKKEKNESVSTAAASAVSSSQSSLSTVPAEKKQKD